MTSSDACHSWNFSAFRVDDRLRALGLAAPAGERLGDDRLEVVDVEEIAVFELVDRRVEVARHGEVDQQQPASAALAHRARDRVRVEHVARRTRRRDDDVGGDEVLFDALERQRLCAEAPRELLRAVERAVGDERDARTAREHVARRLLADLARADEQDQAACRGLRTPAPQGRRRRTTPTRGSRRSRSALAPCAPHGAPGGRRGRGASRSSPARTRPAPGRGSRPRPARASRGRRRRGRDAAPPRGRAGGRAPARPPARSRRARRPRPARPPRRRRRRRRARCGCRSTGTPPRRRLRRAGPRASAPARGRARPVPAARWARGDARCRRERAASCEVGRR